jgi:hypothetical protein
LFTKSADLKWLKGFRRLIGIRRLEKGEYSKRDGVKEKGIK